MKITLCSNMECNYTKIVNGDYCPVCGSKTKTYGFFEGRNWIQDKKKYKKKYKTVEKLKIGFLVCDMCEGRYELQPGEKPEDFYLECECGGKLKYYGDSSSDNVLINLPYCPSCGAKNPNGNFCETCGAILDGTQSESDDSFKNSFLLVGLFGNAKISTKSIIVHKKVLNVTGGSKVEEYPINLIKEVTLSESFNGYDLFFKYEGEYVKLDVPSKNDNPTIDEMENLFNKSSTPTTISRNKSVKKGICPNINCINKDSLDIDSKCPDCGSVVRTAGFSETIKIKVKKDGKGICPNINCINKDSLDIDSKCPDCGSVVRTAGFSETIKIKGKKDKKRREIKNKAKFDRDREKIKQKWVKYAEEKKQYIEDKKGKYGCLKVARGKSSRLELYDNSIKLYSYGSLGNPGQRQVYSIGDIISIDFKEANRLGGFIKFNIRGINTTPDKSGSMLLYGPRTGLTLGVASTGSSDPPITGLWFKGKWEPEFKEIKDIIEAKILENRDIMSDKNGKSSLDDLEKLAELRDKGIITEKEFNAKKKEILGL